MIKVNIAKTGVEIEIKGSEPVIVAEVTILMKRFYKVLRDNHGDEGAKKIITHLCDGASMKPEEAHRIWDERKKEDPVSAWMIEEITRQTLRGESDGK